MMKHHNKENNMTTNWNFLRNKITTAKNLQGNSQALKRMGADEEILTDSSEWISQVDEDSWEDYTVIYQAPSAVLQLVCELSVIEDEIFEEGQAPMIEQPFHTETVIQKDFQIRDSATKQTTKNLGTSIYYQEHGIEGISAYDALAVYNKEIAKL